MDQHNDERNELNAMNDGAEGDIEFEQFLRQFTLREAAPLPRTLAAKQSAGSGAGWFGRLLGLPFLPSGRGWAVAAAGLLLAISLSLSLVRKPEGQMVKLFPPLPQAPVVAVGSGPTVSTGPETGGSHEPNGPADPRPVATESRPAPAVTPSGIREIVPAAQSLYQPISARVLPNIPADMGGPDRFLTHVSTDKPIYRIGETVFIRGVVLRADGHKPVADGQTAATFQIKGPKGEQVASGYSALVNSTVSFSWRVPEGQSGGEYKVTVLHSLFGDAPAERKFEIRAYRAPRLKSQIVFLRDGYGPGDTVSASLHVERAEGGLPSGAKVSVSARVDETEVWSGTTTVDAAGNAGTTFKLPVAIVRGEGTLAMNVQDGGIVETASKTIPIVLQTVDLGIYPEGGDLIAGLSNRIYIEGRTPSQKPADMAGIVVNSAGRQVAAFRTEHDGRGRFTLTPQRGESYTVRLTEPAGIKTTFPLPEVKPSGVVISPLADVVAKQKNVAVRVAATADGRYGIGVTQRGKEIAYAPVTLKAGFPLDVTLTVPKSVDGVLTVTVFNEHEKPLAERLVFRQPEKQLKVQVTVDQPSYVPGEKVSLRVATTDESGNPVSAVVGLTVTDSSVLEMIEKREQAPRLPVMVLLENDVWNLSDAHLYLDPANPKAPIATDLLLGTQGWRRFATADPATFVADYKMAARRALAIRIPAIKTGGSNPMGASRTPASAGVVPGVLGEIDRFFKMADGNGVGVDRNQLLKELSSSVGVVLNEEEWIGLPLYGNDPLTLIRTLPGYRANPMGHEFDTIGGLPLTMINTVRDGLSVTDGFNPGGVGSNVIMNPDMISEIRLILNPVNAAIREYAHPRPSNWKAGSRKDFAETVYWNAAVKTGEFSGVSVVSFDLSDSVTSFRVMADGFAPDGSLGSGTSSIESKQPFSIEPKLPLEVTSGDVIRLPVGMINATGRDLEGADLAIKVANGLKITLPAQVPAMLRAKERSRRVVEVAVDSRFSGTVDLAIDGKAGVYSDTVTRKLVVQPRGYPSGTSKGGILSGNSSQSYEFTLPETVIPGSVSSSVVVYSTPLASMTQALQSLVREPYGCFEQTSSTSYPMVMAQQYFMTHSGVEPSIIEKASGFLESAYKKLVGFETRSNGYEWFGGDPGHEGLTAYGLMQFVDMSQVRDVDKAMIQRTRAWLLARRDEKGGFLRNTRALDSFGRAPDATTNAYITWALVESGETGLVREIAALKVSANASNDSYVVALAANVLGTTGDRDGALFLLDKLAKAQDARGFVAGAGTSITQSGGDSLAIETTALAALAWLKDAAYTSNSQIAMRWIVEKNRDGRFGSTQSTILALRSIVANDAMQAHPKSPGRIQMFVDGKAFGDPVAFTADTKGALILPEFGEGVGAGKHTVALKMDDGSEMPFSIDVKYTTDRPENSDQSKIGIDVALKNTQVQEGGVTEALVSVVNRSAEAIPTPVAIVGIPGGLEVRHEQLKEFVKAGKIASYEVRGRDVVLYWRVIDARAKINLPLSLVAAVPGSYTGPASRAYLYYTDEFKSWAAGLKIDIAPR